MLTGVLLRQKDCQPYRFRGASKLYQVAHAQLVLRVANPLLPWTSVIHIATIELSHRLMPFTAVPVTTCLCPTLQMMAASKPTSQ